MLFVAYYFPPVGGIASIRASRLVAHLPAHGWAATVLAPTGTSQPLDATLGPGDGHVLRARALDLSRLGRKVTSPAAAPSTPARDSLLRRLAHRYFYFPDAQVGWYPAAVRAGRKALASQRFDAIFSSSVPVTAHLIARRLHRDSGVPWVAEFRDPWADVTMRGPLASRRERLERTILREAAAVVTVSPSWKARFEEKGAARVALITNGFDPEDMPAPAEAGAFVVTHLGSLYPGLQDLRAVWAALAKIRGAGAAVGLRFVGELPGPAAAEIAAVGLGDVVEVTGLLPHREALARTAASSLLVMGGFPRTHPLYRGVVPGKTFEYLATGLPVLYVGPGDTDVARLLSAQPACFVVEAGDVAGAARAMEQARTGGRVSRELGEFSRARLARRLVDVLEEVVGAR